MSQGVELLSAGPINPLELFLRTERMPDFICGTTGSQAAFHTPGKSPKSFPAVENPGFLIVDYSSGLRL